MIAMIQNVPAGNALRLWLQPPASATRVRVLRKEADDFTGWDDPDAYVASDGRDHSFTDYTGLINGAEAFYRAFYRINGQWVASETRSATPETTFVPRLIDPLNIVRDRLELGLRNYVTSGEILHEQGYMPVFTATPAFEDAPFPLVTVHLDGDAADMRFIGDEVAQDTFDEDTGLWSTFEGTIDRHDLTIVGWSLNADERINLRNAMKAVILANIGVFDAAGLVQLTFAFADRDDFESYAAPVHQAVCTLTCHAISAVESKVPAIRDVTVNRND